MEEIELTKEDEAALTKAWKAVADSKKKPARTRILPRLRKLFGTIRKR